MPGREDTYACSMDYSWLNLQIADGFATRYRWALITGPKVEKADSKGRLYHAKNGTTKGSWLIEVRPTTLMPTNMLLARVLVGKIADKDRVGEILSGVPATSNDPEWNCVIWVKEALEALQQVSKAMGRSILDWQIVRDAVMDYLQKKKDQGRWREEGGYNTKVVPTYDLLEKQEMTA
ncbi:hypothetical protein MBLNU457_6632t2 [Dothideomycetes sp. NU457]